MAKPACRGGKKTVRIRTAHGVVEFKACKTKRRQRPVSKYAACVGRSIKAAKPKSPAQARRAMQWGAASCKGRTKGRTKGRSTKPAQIPLFPQGHAAMELAWLPVW